GFPFAPDLLVTAAFAHGVQQLNAIAIDDPQDRRGRQKLVGPGPVYGQQTKQARPLGQRGKQFAPITSQPPIKGSIATPFESEEDPHGHDFARPQGRQGMFGAVFHRFIYPIEQLADKVFGRHALSSFCCIGVATHSLRSTHDAFQGPLKLAPLVTMARVLPLRKRYSDRHIYLFFPYTYDFSLVDDHHLELADSNGGHNLPYVLSRDGKVESLENIGGMALGILKDTTYRAKTIQLRAGEGLFLYTDGVTEAMDRTD